MSQGSMSPTNSGAVANMVSASPTEEALMEAKKVTQCAATSHPTAPAASNSLGRQACQPRRTDKNNAVVRPPMATRQNTSGSASMVMSLPRMPVNPKTTTMA